MIKKIVLDFLLNDLFSDLLFTSVELYGDGEY